MLFRFKKVDSPLCSYFNEEEETPLQLFDSCLKSKQLWKKTQAILLTIYKYPTLHSTDFHSRNIQQ